jgi:hypothetical protein
MEETMRVLTITELMRQTRTELCALLTRITNELPAFPEGSVERANAHVKIANIRRPLARRGLARSDQPAAVMKRGAQGALTPVEGHRAARNYGRARCLLTA